MLQSLFSCTHAVWWIIKFNYSLYHTGRVCRARNPFGTQECRPQSTEQGGQFCPDPGDTGLELYYNYIIILILFHSINIIITF